MKKIIAYSLIAFATVSLQAQKDTTAPKDLEIEIDDNSVVIEADESSNLSELDLNTLARELSERAAEIQKQRAEMLAQVEKQEANGDITSEEADEMRDIINDRTEESLDLLAETMEEWEDDNYQARIEAWEEAYEAQWDRWEEEYEARLEAWEAEVEAKSKAGQPVPPVPPMPPAPKAKMPDRQAKADTGKKSRKIIISEDGIIIKEGEDGDKPFAFKFKEDNDDTDTTAPDTEDRKRKKIKTTDGYFDINFGFNVQMEDGQFIVINDPAELDLWKSTQFELGLGWKTRIGNPYSKLYLKYGLEVSWHNFRLKGDNTLQANDSIVGFAPDTEKDISKTKYEIAYFNLPVMLQLDFSEVGEMDDAFTLGVGGYAGVRLDFDRELEFKNALNQEVEEDTDADFFTNQFRYGLIAQIGFDSFKITAKYDLNKFFQADRGPDYNMASISIGLTL